MQSGKERRSTQSIQQNKNADIPSLHRTKYALQQEIKVRKDYHKLGLVHKLIITLLFFSLLFFIAILLLSTVPEFKNGVFKLVFPL